MTDVVAIAAGFGQSVALRSDGTVVAWGDIGTFPANLTGVVFIAVGDSYGVALKNNGTVVTWTPANSTLPGQPAGLNSVVAVASGFSHALALLANGNLVQWGPAGNYQVPAGLNQIVSICDGYYNGLALQADGTVGSLGSGVGAPVPAELSNVVAVGLSHSCAFALKADGTIAHWGFSFDPALTPPSDLTDVIAFSAADSSVVALRDATADTAPVIVTQPASQTLNETQTAVFQVTATGNPALSYQWRKDGINLADGGNVSGATGSTLAIANIRPEDTGKYTVAITNAQGYAVSSSATLALTQAITFAGPADQPYASEPVTLVASADSGLPVAFAVLSGPATLSGQLLTLTGPGAITIEATQAGNAVYAPATPVSRTFNATPSFLSWQIAHFTAEELADATLSGPAALRTQDGLTNLVKYALGLDPRQNVTSGLPVVTVDDANWLFTFTKPAAVTDVVVAVEVSLDLANWTSAGVSLNKLSSTDDLDTWQAAYPVDAAPTVFFRISVVY